MSSREERWEALYEALCNALEKFGTNGTSDDADFWIIDDDWGGHHQKIEIINRAFWSDRIEEAIRAVLADGFQDWGVYVVFEGLVRRGLIVYAGGRVNEPGEPRWP
jgi:hypothetical protein